MRIFLIVLLLLVFGYSIALVFANDFIVEVDLLFSLVPAMNLGLLLIVTICLGVLLGLLLGLQVFRVFQMNWEVSRLKKELESVRAQHIKAAAAAAQSHAAMPNVSEPTVLTDTPKSLH